MNRAAVVFLPALVAVRIRRSKAAAPLDPTMSAILARLKNVRGWRMFQVDRASSLTIAGQCRPMPRDVAFGRPGPPPKPRTTRATPIKKLL